MINGDATSTPTPDPQPSSNGTDTPVEQPVVLPAIGNIIEKDMPSGGTTRIVTPSPDKDAGLRKGWAGSLLFWMARHPEADGSGVANRPALEQTPPALL